MVADPETDPNPQSIADPLSWQHLHRSVQKVTQTDSCRSIGFDNMMRVVTIYRSFFVPSARRDIATHRF